MSARPLIAIPVYNQPKSLHRVVARALEQGADVLVVDDGSDPPIEDLLDDLPVRILRHDTNFGKGAALLTAAAAARDSGHTHLVSCDADGQHDPQQYELFERAVAAHPDAIIIGRRDFASSDAPGSSRFGRAFGNFWVKVQTGVSVGDIQSGYRAYPVSVLRGVSCWTRGYAFEVEVVVRAAWAGVAIENVPVSVHYPPREERVSHFHLGMDNLRLTLLNTHLTLRAILPWPHRSWAGAPPVPSVRLLRPWRSIRLLLGREVTPQSLAWAVAIGVLLGALPLIGVHTILVLIAAGYLRLNKAAAVSASQICMPPLVPAMCIEVGHYLRQGTWLTEVSWRVLGREAGERIWEWILGSLVVAPVLASGAGFLTLMMAFLVRRATRRAPVEEPGPHRGS
jgi:uncharacterized protein (DUF2062 family)